MVYRYSDKNNSTMGIYLMCAIVFVVFSFGWLYFFQPELLAMAQHVLSKGLTHYHRMVGAVLITVLLCMLQWFVYRNARTDSRVIALTYAPSMLVLALLTAVTLTDDGDVALSCSWWTVLLLIVLWAILLFLACKLKGVFRDAEARVYSSAVWMNLLLMCLQMMCVAWLGNTNAVFHYRLKAEQCLLDGDPRGALEVGRKSLESDGHLLMLRMYALAREDAMGERLFEYPITGNSRVMLPTDSLSEPMFYPADSLYKFIGARPVGRIDPMRYLELVQRKDSLPNKTVHDYLLCGYLIDRQLDRFVVELGKYYPVNDSLPKHYREALTLYTHMRSQPVVVYHQTVMDEDYDNFLQLEKLYPDKRERQGKVEEHYRGTYWYYFKYE